jgi:hypothetical protein
LASRVSNADCIWAAKAHLRAADCEPLDCIISSCILLVYSKYIDLVWNGIYLCETSVDIFMTSCFAAGCSTSSIIRRDRTQARSPATHALLKPVSHVGLL